MSTTYRYAFGYEGELFVVFDNEDDACAYQEKFGGYIACFGGFGNAVCIMEMLEPACW